MGGGGEERIHMDTAKLYETLNFSRAGFRVSGACKVRSGTLPRNFPTRRNKSKKRRARWNVKVAIVSMPAV